MNNFTFGNEKMGYYETIAGGGGAGPTWDGESGVHSHMTNCFPEDHEVFTVDGFKNLAAVRAHFARFPTLGVGCNVDGRLEFHPITADKLTVHTGTHDHVLFQDAGGLSLLPTTNHRMWLAMGAGRQWPQVQERDRVKPLYAIHTAEAVVAAGADVQFLTHFEHGLVDEAPLASLPFVGPLALSTSDQVDAFLELYGYWVGDGWLDIKAKAIQFGPSQPQHWGYLDKLLGRLPLTRHPPGSYGLGGFTRAVLAEDRNTGDALKGANPQRSYSITERSWWNYFVAQYGHKYGALGAAAAAEARMVAAAAAAAAEGGADDGASSEPHESEGIKSAKWFWYWVMRRGLGARRRRLILSGLHFANGDEHLSSSEGGRIGTSSVRFRDEVVQLALLAGYSVVFWRHTKAGDALNENIRRVQIRATVDHWSVSYTEAQRRIQPRLAAAECRRLSLTGTVWCVTVPTKAQLIMVRRVLETTADGVVVRASRPVIVGNTRITGTCNTCFASPFGATSAHRHTILFVSTDAEILERKYPVLLTEFAIRRGSGGKGRHRGGDGVVREIQFLQPLTVGILSERRAFGTLRVAQGGDQQY